MATKELMRSAEDQSKTNRRPTEDAWHKDLAQMTSAHLTWWTDKIDPLLHAFPNVAPISLEIRQPPIVSLPLYGVNHRYSEHTFELS